MRTCSIEGCNERHKAKGYCEKHYRQIKAKASKDTSKRTKFDPNEIIEHEDYAEVVLYKQNNEVARALIDLEYVEIVKRYKWGLDKRGYVYNNQVGFLHRFIMNPPDDLVVDHINHNKLDNRRDNLRVCTQQENAQNRPIQCNNTSGITGVTWDKRKNKWRATISVNGKRKYLGYFNSKEEAADVRRLAEVEYFGEFAPNNKE
jgi:hypothetical protein